MSSGLPLSSTPNDNRFFHNSMYEIGFFRHRGHLGDILFISKKKHGLSKTAQQVRFSTSGRLVVFMLCGRATRPPITLGVFVTVLGGHVISYFVGRSCHACQVSLQENILLEPHGSPPLIRCLSTARHSSDRGCLQSHNQGFQALYTK